jgi:hypothetical protein
MLAAQQPNRLEITPAKLHLLETGESPARVAGLFNEKCRARCLGETLGTHATASFRAPQLELREKGANLVTTVGISPGNRCQRPAVSITGLDLLEDFTSRGCKAAPSKVVSHAKPLVTGTAKEADACFAPGAPVAGVKEM